MIATYGAEFRGQITYLSPELAYEYYWRCLSVPFGQHGFEVLSLVVELLDRTLHSPDEFVFAATSRAREDQDRQRQRLRPCKNRSPQSDFPVRKPLVHHPSH